MKKESSEFEHGRVYFKQFGAERVKVKMHILLYHGGNTGFYADTSVSIVMLTTTFLIAKEGNPLIIISSQFHIKQTCYRFYLPLDA